jgi:hypothetical protein
LKLTVNNERIPIIIIIIIIIIIMMQKLTVIVGRGMAELASRRAGISEDRVHARVSSRGICGGKDALRQAFSEFFGFPLSISFHPGSP